LEEGETQMSTDYEKGLADGKAHAINAIEAEAAAMREGYAVMKRHYAECREDYETHMKWYRAELQTFKEDLARLLEVARAQSTTPDEGAMLQ